MKDSLKRFEKLTACAFLLLVLALSAAFGASAADAITLESPKATATTVSLKWTALEGADGYRLYSLDEEGKAKKIDDFDATGCKVKKLDPKTEYSFILRSYELDGKEKTLGKKSNLLTVKTEALPVAENVSTSATATTVTLSWSKVSEADGYRVYLKNENGEFKSVGTPTGTSVTIGGLPQGTKHIFKLRPFVNGSDGTRRFGKASDEIEAKTGIVTAKGFRLVKRTDTTLEFEWKKAAEADGYLVRRIVNGKPQTVATTTKTSVIIKSLKPNSSFVYFVVPFSNTRDGSRSYGKQSNSRSTTTLMQRPDAPLFVSSSTSAVSFKWKAVKDAESYEILFRPSGDYPFETLQKKKGTSSKISGLKPGSKYIIRVKAFSDSNNSQQSTSLVVYTKPEKVSGLTATKKGPTSISLEWKSDCKYAKFVVYAKKPSDEKWSKKATTAKPSATVSGLKADTKYELRVHALISRDGLEVRSSAADISAKTSKVKLTLSGSTSARKGEYLRLKASGTGVTSKNTTWTSSNTGVVKISGGRPLAVGTGSCTVTASCGGQKASKKVSISSAVISYRSAVFNVTTGSYDFQSRINERCYPGSITKLITALVAVKYCSLDTRMTVGNELNLLESMASRANISRGERFTLEQLLYGMLLPSGCDCAYTIAVNVARKVSGNSSMGYSSAANYFVGLMNSYMKSIGCTGSHMVNPHGYPYNSHYTTVADMILVGRRILKTPVLAKITSTSYKYVTALSGRGRGWSTTNLLISSRSGYYCRYSHGLKTGTVNNNYTDIMSAATKDGKTIITAVFGAESFNARYDATWKLYRNYLY